MLSLLGILMALAGCSDGWLGLPKEMTLTASVAYPFGQQNEFQNIISSDVYVDGQAAHVVFAAVSKDLKSPAIFYARSEDSGLHWTAPVIIPALSAQSLESKQGNDLQLAVFGSRIVVVAQTTGEMFGMGPMLTLVSGDYGKTWQQGANPAGGDYDQSHFDLVADPQGVVHLVWLDDLDENGYQGLRHAKSSDAGKHWQPRQTLDDSTCSCCWNKILASSEGRLNILYRDMEPRDMALQQSTDNGGSWQRLSTVGAFNWQFTGCPHTGGGLAATAKALHSVVWTGAENKVGLYYLRSDDQGKNWHPPQQLGKEQSAMHGDIAALDDNRIAVVWDGLKEDKQAIFIAESLDGGATWSNAKQLSLPGISASYPKLVKTPAGLLATWNEQQNNTSKVLAIAVINKTTADR